MMAVLIVLGMFMDWVGILLLTMPIFVPIIKNLGYDPIWFGILFCMNMQISYLSPPFGPAAFYLKSVAPPEISLQDIFRSLWPFMLMQLIGLLLVIVFPEIALWLPRTLKERRSLTGKVKKRAEHRFGQSNNGPRHAEAFLPLLKIELVYGTLARSGRPGGSWHGPRSRAPGAVAVRVQHLVPHPVPGVHHRARGLDRRAGGALADAAAARSTAICREFWTRIFAVSFGMGVVSGIVMSFQFGTNWSELSNRAGNVLGPLLHYEVLTAFFLEASFLGILLFGRDRVPRWVHFGAACAVAAGTLISAFWILAANSWMQTPAGYELREGTFHVVSWWQVVFNPSFPYRFAHMVTAAFLTTAFVVAGVSAWHLSERACGAARRGRPVHGARPDHGAGAGAAGPRRPARAEHVRAPAGQGRGDGGPLGDPCRRAARAVRPARSGGRDQPLRGRDPEARQPDPHPRARRHGARARRNGRPRSGRTCRSCSGRSA